MKIVGIILVMIALLVAAVSVVNGYRQHRSPPVADKGVLDLSGWDLKTDGNVTLAGEWEFYWEEFKEDFGGGGGAATSPLYLQVPGYWNGVSTNSGWLGGSGYGTYRLRVITGTDLDRTELALKLITISTAYRIMIDRDVVAEAGTIGTDTQTSKAGYEPGIVRFQAPADSFDIIVQASNFDHGRGGLWLPVYLGTFENMLMLQSESREAESLLYGGILLLLLCFPIIFLHRNAFSTALPFMVLVCVVLLKMFVSGEHLLARLVPGASFHLMLFLLYLVYYWVTVVYIWFLRTVFPRYVSLRLQRAVVWVAGGFTALTVALPSEIYTHVLTVYDYIIYLQIAYILFVNIRVMVAREKNSLLLFLTTCVLVFTGVNDLLYHRSIFIVPFRQLMPYGLLLFLLGQAAALGRIFADLYIKSENMSKELRDLDQLKDDFLANTTHELQTPLNGIINLAQSLLHSPEAPLTEPHEKKLSIIRATAERLSMLIRDIVDLTRLKRDEIRIRPARFNMYAGVIAVADLFQYSAAAKPVRIAIDLPADLPPVYADENRVGQILYNLLSNAVKFTPRGLIGIGGTMEQGMVKLTVEDSGIGIAEDKREKIFEYYEQADPDIYRLYGGTGIGLAISRKLAEKMGGALDLEWSEPGAGSRFALRLPVYVANGHDGEPETAPSASGQTVIDLYSDKPAIAKQARTTVLIADDNATNLHALAGILEPLDCNVIAALDGNETMAIMEQEGRAIHLLLLDIMMPFRSGFDICRELRRKYSLVELPILMITARNTQEDIGRAFEAGANDYVVKPFEAGEVRSRVQTLLGLAEANREAVRNEMAFLYSQIRPHFINNALNAISSLCVIDGTRASETVDKLAIYLQKMFREAGSRPFVTLEWEMELVDVYLDIEKERFRERLRIVYDIDHAPEFRLPPLIIQPIVENAVSHGVMKKLAGGTVWVTVRHREEELYVEVRDDGVGIAGGRLASLIADSESRNRIGLANINSRLNKLYKHSLTIRSEEGSGTVVSFTIPDRSMSETEVGRGDPNGHIG